MIGPFYPHEKPDSPGLPDKVSYSGGPLLRNVQNVLDTVVKFATKEGVSYDEAKKRLGYDNLDRMAEGSAPQPTGYVPEDGPANDGAEIKGILDKIVRLANRKGIPFEEARKELGIPELDSLWKGFSPDMDNDPAYAPEKPIRRSRKSPVQRKIRHASEADGGVVAPLVKDSRRYSCPIRYTRRLVSTSGVVVKF